MYDDLGYARSRLDNTIIRDSEGTLSQVREIHQEGPNIVCYYKNLLTREDCKDLLNNMNIKAFSGFNVNYKGNSYYVTRQPKRNDWRQGMRANNTYIRGMMGGTARLITSKQFAECFSGKYPSFEESLEKLSEGGDYVAIAFSRRFSLHGFYDTDNIQLRYRGLKNIGEIVDGTPELSDGFKYLKEELEDSLKC